MDYLSYTTKVYQLVQRYSLTSVLLYDREYRKILCSMGFRWGTDVQHLHTLFLQPRATSTNSMNSSSGSKRPGGNPRGPKPQRVDQRKDGLCRNYNSDKGCTYTECRFKHLCMVPGCGQSHSAVAHSQQKKVDIEVNPLPSLHFAAWEAELDVDYDREFLLQGIKCGFDIIDDSSNVHNVSCPNHPSARPNSPLYEKATAQVVKEIENGNYVICDRPP